MEFFRKVYKGTSQWIDEITEDLCSLGFVSAVDGKDFPDEQFGSQWLKWNGEPLLTTSTYTQGRFLQPSTLGNALRISVKECGEPGMSSFESYCALFFIPLANNSFFIRTTDSSATTSIPYFPGLSNMNPNASPHYGSLFTYMGLSTTISNYSPFLYYIYRGNGLPDNENYTYYHLFVDRNEVFQLEGMDHPYKDPNNKFPPLDSVSVSAGTCVLVRVPYTNDYIDGLYYVAVSPQDSIDGKFFSFGGRNFMGAGRNLVVELPAN